MRAPPRHLTAAQQAEIDAQRGQTQPTRRVTVEALEEVLYQAIPVLDHGFIRVVDYMGDDSAVVQAARVSYGRGTRQVSEDQGLINYLMRHRHTTPFEMCEIKYHVKLPIFVARQWIRHRTANVNEYSARYSILDNEFYIPRPSTWAPSRGATARAERSCSRGRRRSAFSPCCAPMPSRPYDHYAEMLNEDEAGGEIDPARQGLARELARMNLSLNFYTQWYWKIDLLNLLHFLGLRADAHAQYEIRAYAEAMLESLRRWVPLTYTALMEYRIGGASLSKTAMDVLRRLLAGEPVSQEQSGLSKREWRELMATLGREG